NPFSSTFGSCANYCLWEHEMDHSRSDTCQNTRRPFPGPPEPVVFSLDDECCAYAQQLKCLFDFLKNRCRLNLSTLREQYPQIGQCVDLAKGKCRRLRNWRI